MNTKRVLWMMAVAFVWSGATAHAWDESENQLWLQGSVETQVGAKLKLKLAEEFRYKDSGADEFYHHTDFTLGYAMTNGWSVAGTYRYIDKERKNGEWLVDNMALLDLCKKTGVSGVELKGRLRATYTDKRSTDDDPWEVRTRFDIAPEKGWTSWKLKPYLADEVMYDLCDSRLYRNRAYVGLKVAPQQHVGANLYLMQDRLETADGDWNEFYVLGGCVALKF